MKIAFACWEDRIAPVFDTARQIRLVEFDSGNIVSQIQDVLPNGLPLEKASRLVELGTHTLVCGAISQSLQALIVGHGIVVIPFVAGELGEVIQAWREGNLINDKFVMPGCCGRGLRGRGNRHESEQFQAPGWTHGPELSIEESGLHGGVGRRRGRTDSN